MKISKIGIEDRQLAPWSGGMRLAEQPGFHRALLGWLGMTSQIRVVLPQHLRTLAGVGSEVTVEVQDPVTICSVLDAVETRYPMLQGTIRDHVTKQRRAFLRFFACEEDLSHEPTDSPLPEAITSGKEPFLVIGAIAGG
jgi:hypothetical protein